MGRRALRTGDLVIPDVDGRVVTMYDRAGGGDIVGLFSFGLYMGYVRTPASTNRRTGLSETFDSAFVFDSETMKYGWVSLRWLKRVS